MMVVQRNEIERSTGMIVMHEGDKYYDEGFMIDGVVCV